MEWSDLLDPDRVKAHLSDKPGPSDKTGPRNRSMAMVANSKTGLG
jgi:hypothetical protein